MTAPRLLAPLLLGTLCGCAGEGAADASSERAESPSVESWVDLFDGASLVGWTPKIRGLPLGDDPRNTFRVQDGLLTVGYEGYDSFDDTFGHLFYEVPFDAYELRVEYRFVGEQMPNGPGWARRNSGIMFHSQAPATMGLDQDFPISLELQFLGGSGDEVRPTANLCTPGTHVDIGGELETAHCISADAPTFPDSSWVDITLLVRANGSITHLVGGDTVLAYTNPVVGGGEVHGIVSDSPEVGTPLRQGYIALQSESHPIQFRTVSLRPLEH